MRLPSAGTTPPSVTPGARVAGRCCVHALIVMATLLTDARRKLLIPPLHAIVGIKAYWPWSPHSIAIISSARPPATPRSLRPQLRLVLFFCGGFDFLFAARMTPRHERPGGLPASAACSPDFGRMWFYGLYRNEERGY